MCRHWSLHCQPPSFSRHCDASMIHNKSVSQTAHFSIWPHLHHSYLTTAIFLPCIDHHSRRRSPTVLRGDGVCACVESACHRPRSCSAWHDISVDVGHNQWWDFIFCDLTVAAIPQWSRSVEKHAQNCLFGSFLRSVRMFYEKHCCSRGWWCTAWSLPTQWARSTGQRQLGRSRSGPSPSFVLHISNCHTLELGDRSLVYCRTCMLTGTHLNRQKLFLATNLSIVSTVPGPAKRIDWTGEIALRSVRSDRVLMMIMAAARGRPAAGHF